MRLGVLPGLPKHHSPSAFLPAMRSGWMPKVLEILREELERTELIVHSASGGPIGRNGLGAFCWTTNHRRNMRGMIGALCSAAASSSRLTRRTVYA
jgi:hypothetical protein